MKSILRNTLSLSCATLLLATGSLAHAATTADPVKAQLDADKKVAGDRYASDKKLCDDEQTSGARMQCKRDASDEYKKALAAAQAKYDQAKKAPAPAAAATAAVAAPKAGAAVCLECGKVTGVKIGEKEGKGSPVGMIAGGVAGALLGHQVGKGSGKDIATIAGAAGGAYAGHKVEEKMTATKYWAVSVRFDNGDERSYSFDHEPGFAVGDSVKAAGSGIVRR